MSVPYHVVADTAEGLCMAADAAYGPGDGLATLTQIDFSTGRPVGRTHICGTGIGEFDLNPGEGILINPKTDPPGGTLDFQWVTY